MKVKMLPTSAKTLGITASVVYNSFRIFVATGLSGEVRDSDKFEAFSIIYPSQIL